MPRKPAYDREIVLEKALKMFWADGYRGVDVDALTRTVGLNRHSLYGAFGGKKGLFHQSLNRYADTIAGQFVVGLGTGTGLSAIVTYFSNATKRLGADRQAGTPADGCFIANTIIELGRADQAVNAIIDRFYSRIEQAFGDAVRRGQGDGTIRADLDPANTAQWLIATSQGMSVGARFGRATCGLLPALEASLAAPSRRQPRNSV